MPSATTSHPNAAHVLSSDPARPVALTAGGRAQARALGAQLANLPIDLAVGTRLLRMQQTIDLALDGRPVPVVIEPGFDELRAGDLDGAPMDAYWQNRFVTPGPSEGSSPFERAGVAVLKALFSEVNRCRHHAGPRQPAR
jgi:broad specificity phosphatase PhoE